MLMIFGILSILREKEASFQSISDNNGSSQRSFQRLLAAVKGVIIFCMEKKKTAKKVKIFGFKLLRSQKENLGARS